MTTFSADSGVNMLRARGVSAHEEGAHPFETAASAANTLSRILQSSGGRCSCWTTWSDIDVAWGYCRDNEPVKARAFCLFQPGSVGVSSNLNFTAPTPTACAGIFCNERQRQCGDLVPDLSHVISNQCGAPYPVCAVGLKYYIRHDTSRNEIRQLKALFPFSVFLATQGSEPIRQMGVDRKSEGKHVYGLRENKIIIPESAEPSADSLLLVTRKADLYLRCR
jgi:hypothetical protein